MKKNLNKLVMLMTVAMLVLAACGGGKVAESRLERADNPQVPADQMEVLTSGNSAFAFDLYDSLRAGSGNMVFSPFSVSLAFAMTYGGARGETAAEMAEVMHFSLPEGEFHPAFNALDLELAQRPDQDESVDEDERFELSIANSLWGQEDWPFLPEYLDLLAENYGAGMRLVDFQNSPEAARRQINDWVADETRRRIQDILPAGMPGSDTRLALANAIYFKATWEYEFDANDTTDRPFYLLNGEAVDVPMMTIENGEVFAYAAGETWQAVALPYRGGLTEMVVIMPQAGAFEDFEANLTLDGYNAIVAALESQQVVLSLPKFSFEASYGLSDALRQMGMLSAFDPNVADFSGMDGARDLYIGDALHKAFIAVDEEGTEAAAATIVLMALSSMPMQGIEVTIDQPFFYVIRDVPSGTLLFMGRVVDPR